MFQTEGGTSGTPFNAMRRPAAINMRADANLSATAAATAFQPIAGAVATPPQNTFISWAPQAQLPVTTQGGAGPTILTSPSMWHVSTTDRSPALADMGALKSYLQYCGDSARRENAVQVQISEEACLELQYFLYILAHWKVQHRGRRGSAHANMSIKLSITHVLRARITPNTAKPNRLASRSIFPSAVSPPPPMQIRACCIAQRVTV